MNICPILDSKDKSLISVIGMRQFFKAWLETEGNIPDELYSNPTASQYYLDRTENDSYTAIKTAFELMYVPIEDEVEPVTANNRTQFDVEVIQLMSNALLQIKLNTTKVGNSKIPKLRETLKNRFIVSSRNENLSIEIRNNLQKVVENFDTYFDKSLNFLNKRFGIEVVERDTDIDDSEINKAFNEGDRFKENYKDTMSFFIKQLFTTTHQLLPNTDITKLSKDKQGNYVYPYDTTNFLGSPTFIDYERILPFVTRELSKSTDYEDMMDRLDVLIDYEPSLIQIKHKLESDSNLRAAFWTTFNMQSPDVEVILQEFDGSKVVLKKDKANNVSKSDKKLAEKWALNVQIKQSENYYDGNWFRSLNNSLEKIATKKLTVEELAEEIASIMNNFGLTVDTDTILKGLNSKGYSQKFSGKDNDFYSIYNNIFHPVFIRLVRTNNNEKFRDLGNLNTLASYISNFHFGLNESSYLNVNGDLVYDFIKPNFLSEFFKIVNSVKGDLTNEKNENKLKALLSAYARENGMEYSNLLFGKNGILIDNGNGEYSINKKNLDKFNYGLFGGLKNTSKNIGYEYESMSDKDWILSQVHLYLKDIEKDTVSFAIPVPSDAGVIYNISMARFKAELDSKGELKQGELYSALYNTILQEVERIKAASQLMFDVDGNGNLMLKPDVDTSQLEKNYYWKKQGEYLKSGELRNYPTGLGFMFHNMKIVYSDGKVKTLNEVKDSEGYSINELVYRGLFNETLHKPLIEEFMNEWIKGRQQRTIETLQELQNDGSLEAIPNYKVINNDFNRLTTEIALNTYLSIVEQNNLFNGQISEYKNALDTNKRAKQIISPGNGIFTIRPTYKSATIADIKLESKSFNEITEGVAQSLKEFQTFKSTTISVEAIKKASKDGNIEELNDFELAVYKIVNKYISSNIADAQGYVSMSRYKEILQGLGRYDTHYKNIFDKLERQYTELKETGKVETKFTNDELSRMLEPIKGFYFDRTYNTYLNRMVSEQIKYSTVPLIPQLVAGTDLEKLMYHMTDNEIDELVYESAEKVGTTHIAKIADKDGNLLPDFANSIKPKLLNNKSWRLQQDNPNHLMDYESNVGTQLAKLVIDNLLGVYNIGSNTYEANDLISHYMNLIAANIKDDFLTLASRLGIEREGNSWTIKDLDMVQSALLEEIRDRGLGENFEDALQYVNAETKEFKLPLFISSMSKKYESIVLSFFDKNVRKRKQYGGLAVLFSNAFTQKKTLDEVGDGSGIEWLDSYTNKNGTKLKMATIEDGKVTEIPVLLPAYSKKFFEREKVFDDEGKVVDFAYTNRIDINELEKQAPELLTMIGYRIPTETKHSMIVLKIVGFLPQESGGTIVLPDEVVTQSGADFDIDKLFLLTYSFYKTKRGFEKIEYIEGTDADSIKRRYQNFMRTSRTLSKKRSFIKKKFDAQIDRLTETRELEYKARSKKIDLIINQLSGLEGQDKINQVFEFIKGEDYNSIAEYLEAIESEIEHYSEGREEVANEINRFYTTGLIEEMESSELKLIDYDNKLALLRDKEAELNRVLSVTNSEEYRDEIKKRKSQNNRYKEQRANINARIKEEIDSLVNFDDFAKLSVEEQNTELARQNRVLDVFRSILENPTHYAEVIAPNSFEKLSAIKKEQDSINLRNETHLNPTTFESQNSFRAANISGRGLKGLAVNSKGFTTIGQVANIRFREDLGFKVKYTKDLDIISSRYKDSIIETGDDYVIVNHTLIGKAPDGTYLSSDGTLITDNMGSVVANILDIVKEGLPDNINLYTFESFSAMLMTGVEIDFASWFMGQPIMQTLSKTTFEKKGILSEDDNKAIQDTKNLYLKELFRVLNILNSNKISYVKDKQTNEAKKTQDGKSLVKVDFNYNDKGTKKSDSVILYLESNGNINFPKVVTKGDKKINLFETLFGFNPSKTFTPSVEELKEDYINSNKYRLKDLNTNTPNKNKELSVEELKEKATLLRRQIQLLETFNRSYKKSGEAVNDAIKVTSFDRTNVGPNFNKIMSIEDKMYYIENYKESRYEPSSEEREEREEGGEIIEDKTNKSGARLLVGTSSFVKAIYPKFFGDTESKSVYPLLEVFYEYGFKTALDTFQGQFINTSDSWRQFKRDFYFINGLKPNESTNNKLDDFLNYVITSGFKNFSETEFKRNLGIENQDIPTGNLSIEQFNQLSAAQKVYYIQNNMTDLVKSDSYNILNILNPQLKGEIISKDKQVISKSDYSRNGNIHLIKMDMSTMNYIVDDYIMNDFYDMLHSNNPFLKSTAESLVDYLFMTNGMQFKVNSFARYLPNKYLVEQGYGDYLRGVAEKVLSSNFGFSNYLNSFLLNNAKDSNIVPVVMTEYLEDNEDGSRRIKGETKSKKKVDWNNVHENILIVNKSKLKNEDASVINASYIRVQKGKTQSQLYKKVEESDGIESDKFTYYLPVQDTSNRHYINLYNKSLIAENIDFELALNTIKDWESRNNKQEQKTAFGSEETLTEYHEKKQKLIEAFEKVGVKVQVIEDSSIEGAGQVSNENGDIVIRVNPENMLSDTIFHEFGHILVDSLPSNLVKAGVEQLKGTQLYEDVKSLYPDLNEELLGKEVLTTAIGIEADRIFKDNSKKAFWLLWLNKMFDTLKNIFGIKESLVQQLAKQLVNQNIDKDIQIRLDNVVHQQKTRTTLSDLKWNNKFIESVLIDIQTRISTKNQTEDMSTLQDLKQLVEDMVIMDEIQSLNNYSIWVTKNIDNLKTQFNNYSGLTYEKYKEFSEVEKRNFINFMRESNEFLYHIKKVEKLEYILDKSTDANIRKGAVIESLKSIEPTVSDLRNRWFNLSQQFAQKYVELSSNPVYGGRGNVQNVDKFLSPQMDETFMQLHLDAMFDTNHPLIANVIKQYNYELFKADEEIKKRTSDWLEVVKAAKEAGVDINEFIEKDGRLLQEIDYLQFYKDKYEFLKELGKKADKDTTLYAKELAKWYSNNTVKKSKEEIETIAREKRKWMTVGEYKEWKGKVMSKIEFYDGTTKTVYKGELTRPNPKVYKNKKFIDIVGEEGNRTSKQKAAHDFYKYLTSEFAYLVEHTQDNIIKQGYIPSIPTVNINSFKEGVEYTLGKLGFGKKGQVVEGVVTNGENEIVNYLPFNYLSLLNQQELKVIPKDADLETIKEIRKANQEIKRQNREAHYESIVKDLNEIMSIFIKTAIQHKYKAKIESELLVAKEMMKQSEILKTNGLGKVLTNIVSKKVTGTTRNETIKGENSNTYEHFDKWLKMVYYDKFELDEGRLQQMTALLQNYVSIRGLGFNYISGVNNYIYGKTMLLTESVAGQFFSNKAYAKSIKDFNTSIGNYIASYVGNMGKVDYSTVDKTSAIIHYFDIMQTADEFNINGDKNKALIDKAMMFRNFAFFQQHIGEFTVQNEALLAMMNDYKIIDGKLVNFNEYIQTLYEKKNLTMSRHLIKSIDKDIAKRRRELRVKAREEFKSMKSLYDAIEFKDGKLDFSNLNLNENEIAEFKNKVIGVNQDLHGIYNKADAGTIQNRALGRMAMQFRKWMRPGWNRRFGSRFGESYWNERRGRKEEGMYVSTANFVFQPISDSSFKDENGNFVGFKAIGIVLQGYKEYLSNITLHWESLDETQKANVKRSVAELLILTGVITSGLLLKNLKSDDDDDNNLLNWLAYQQDRTKLEMLTYVPIYGWFNESKKLLRSPAASLTVIEDAIRVFADLAKFPFIDSEEENFKSGMYHGQSKLEVHTKKLLPFVNQIQRIKNFNNEVRYYKLF